MFLRLCLGLLLLLNSCSQRRTIENARQSDRTDSPNIILIMADDMGFSDLGCYGSEISTPNLDRLGYEGIRFARFYNAGRCCPSRASLLTGLYPHQAGIGGMTDQDITLPSYQGYFHDSVRTVADHLQAAGYATLISGKWHLGDEPENWPSQHGFSESFSFLQGAASYYDFLPYRSNDWPWSDGKQTLVRNNQKIRIDSSFYATDLYTDMAINLVNQTGDQPFFLYLPYTAPHWPLHALPEDIAKYKGKYNIGWDDIREQRYKKLTRLGLISDTRLSPRDPRIPAWDSTNAPMKDNYASRMEVYAAMVDRMDQNIGRLLEALSKTGKLENTWIFFLSDNGGSRPSEISYLASRFSPEADTGSPESFKGYGIEWANVSNAPFRLYKAQMHEGGISTPLIVWHNGLRKDSLISEQRGHLTDLAPTILALAGIPDTLSWEGISLVPAIQNGGFQSRGPIFFEHFGNRAVNTGKWKLVALEGASWELYDIAADRSESNDLADQYPEVVTELSALYDDWADRVGVHPLSVVRENTIVRQQSD